MEFIWNTVKSGKAKFSIDKLLWEGDKNGSVDLFKQIYRCDLLKVHSLQKTEVVLRF